MKKLFTLLVALFIAGAYAQETQDIQKPDFTSIRKNIANKDSDYYYFDLFDRYNRADTSMTLEERRHLYYGLAFVELATPKNVNTAQVKLKEILHKPNPDENDLKDVVAYTGVILQAYPFSISIKKYREFCLKELGLYDEAAKERTQSDILIDAMLSSGDGTTHETPIYVINLKNEYELVEVLGFETMGESYTANNQYDYLLLDKNAYQLDGLFFNTMAVTQVNDF